MVKIRLTKLLRITLSVKNESLPLFLRLDLQSPRMSLYSKPSHFENLGEYLRLLPYIIPPTPAIKHGRVQTRIVFWDTTRMTSMKIVQISRPSTPLLHLRPKFLHPFDLGRPILNETPSSLFK